MEREDRRGYRDRHRNEYGRSRPYRGRGGGGRGYSGHKRGRDEDYQVDHRGRLLKLAFQLGDAAHDQEQALSSQMYDLMKQVYKRTQPQEMEQVQGILLDCALEISTKTPIYATLIGLLNSEVPDLVGGLLTKAFLQFNKCLMDGGRHKLRMLLRLFCSLALCNVINSSAVLQLLQSIIDTCNSIADQNNEDMSEATVRERQDKARMWQPWSDYLAYIVLVSLPWGAAELRASAPEELKSLLHSVQEYMDKRPKDKSVAFMPIVGEGDEDLLRKSDSGGASFLGQLWEAVLEVHDNNWEITSILNPHQQPQYENQLASGQPHDIEVPEFPTEPPGVDTSLSAEEFAVALAAAYPPRGGIPFLDQKQTQGKRQPIESIIVEEYILDTLYYFDGNVVECAHRLVQIPLDWPHGPLLAQTLFSQLFKLPAPELPELGYITIMVNVCKIMQQFPRSIAGCVKACFSRMHLLDPELRRRLAKWLALHLSNFGFVWPWDKWKAVTTQDGSSHQRRFCVMVLLKLMQLSYWERVHEVIPESFYPLLGPKPQILLTPLMKAQEKIRKQQEKEKEKQQQQQQQPQQEQQQQQGQGEEIKEEDMDEKEDIEVDDQTPEIILEGEIVDQLVQLIRVDKKISEDLILWLEAEDIKEKLGGHDKVLAMCIRTLLTVGIKTATHLNVAFTRYHNLISKLKQELPEGPLAADLVMLNTITRVWALCQLHTRIAVETLLRNNLIELSSVVQWALTNHLLTFDNLGCWEETLIALLYHVVELADLKIKKGEKRLERAKHNLQMAVRDRAHREQEEALADGDQDVKDEEDFDDMPQRDGAADDLSLDSPGPEPCGPVMQQVLQPRERKLPDPAHQCQGPSVPWTKGTAEQQQAGSWEIVLDSLSLHRALDSTKATLLQRRAQIPQVDGEGDDDGDDDMMDDVPEGDQENEAMDIDEEGGQQRNGDGDDDGGAQTNGAAEQPAELEVLKEEEKDRVQLAEEEQEAAEQDLEKCKATEEQLLVLVFKLFHDGLAAHAADEESLVYKSLLTELRTFSRHFYVKTAMVLEKIQEEVLPEATPLNQQMYKAICLEGP